jgi:hypothetical protein
MSVLRELTPADVAGRSPAQTSKRSPTWRPRIVWFAILLTGLLVSRIPLAPRYLVTFDEINFAFAIREFNPTLHQPQPPGYPLFVGFLKLLSFLPWKVETIFLVSGLLMSLAALLSLWALGERTVGRNRGVIAALLLLFNPPFWFAALTNPVRLCLAAGATAVALCFSLALERSSAAWYLAAAAALGMVDGFRPGLTLVLFPLALWVTLRLRPGWKMIVAAALLFLLAESTWLPVLAAAAGGWRPLWQLLFTYTRGETHSSSLLFGASLRAAAHMAWQAIVWTGLGVLSWIWAFPPVLRRDKIGNLDSGALQFLAIWFVPGFLFLTLFHTGDPDHTLAIVPVTCLLGTCVLNSLAEQRPPRALAGVVLVAVSVNAVLFFKPISKIARETTYRTVRWLDDYTASVIEGVQALPRREPMTVVFLDSILGWRHVSYYAPDAQVLVLSQRAAGSITVRRIEGKHLQTRTASGPIHLPACGILTWVDPVARPASDSGASVFSMNPHVSFAPGTPNTQFEFRGFHFQTDEALCSKRP